MPQVLAALAPHLGPHHLIISIAAGVTLATYEAALPEGTRVIRIMPNTPMLVQRGASAYCLGRWATEEDEQKLNVLLRPTGLVVPVEEKMMDAVTGLSGSGPAFVYMMIEAMADGGVLAGLPRERALQLAAQTVAGAAHMVMEACEDGELAHPGECVIIAWPAAAWLRRCKTLCGGVKSCGGTYTVGWDMHRGWAGIASGAEAGDAGGLYATGSNADPST